MNISFMFLLMIFLHIVDDFYLQGILAQLKQRQWWIDNEPFKLYRYDYIVALIVHSFSWAFMIMLPIAIYQNFNIKMVFIVAVIINALIHAITDNAKANKRIINLCVDQLIHLVQIMVTFLIFPL